MKKKKNIKNKPKLTFNKSTYIYIFLNFITILLINFANYNLHFHLTR